MRLHVADLHRRGVRPQQRPHQRRAVAGDRRQRLRQVQRVLHVARGMLGRHVQRVEVVPVVLDLGAFDDREAHAREDLLDPLAHDGQRMAMAEARPAAGQRDVDAAGGRGVLRRVFVGAPARLDRLLQLVGVAADVLLLIGRRAADQLHPARRRCCSCVRDSDREGTWRRRATRRPPARARTRRRARRRRLGWGEVGHRSSGLELGAAELATLQLARSTQPLAPDVYARAAALALAAFDATAFSAFFADLTAIFAARLGLLGQRRERRRAGDRQLREALAIERDAGVLQAVDQLAVGQAVLARRGVDADDPQAAEVALLAAAADEGVLERGVDRFLRGAIQLALVGVVALGASFSSFLRLARRTVPRFTRGILYSLILIPSH